MHLSPFFHSSSHVDLWYSSSSYFQFAIKVYMMINVSYLFPLTLLCMSLILFSIQTCPQPVRLLLIEPVFEMCIYYLLRIKELIASHKEKAFVGVHGGAGRSLPIVNTWTQA